VQSASMNGSGNDPDCVKTRRLM